MPGFLVGIGKAGDVAERSPAVISANLKEDMLLQKKLVVINRSERSVIHQIKVDQKVMYKRFQARLTCSKLAHARLMGQRELQMQLRAKTLGTLDTDIAGNSDEDYAFLEKLEQRPCTTNSFSQWAGHSPRPLKTRKESVQSEKQPEITQDLQKRRSSSAKARYYRDGSSGKDMAHLKTTGHVPTTVRPATTLGARVEENFRRHQQESKEEEEADDSGKSKENQSSGSAVESIDVREGETEETNSQSSEVSNTKRHSRPNVAFLEHLDIGEARPQTVADVSQWNNSIPSSPTSPKQYSRRTSRAADFFQAEEKIDLVSLRLQEAKTHDFTENVQKFCEELEQMKCARANPDVDYYSVRLQISLDQANSKSLIEVPGTPDDENKRSIGNLFVKSLTLPTINMNDE